MDTKKAVQIAIGLGVLFATVWVVGKAWKKSQNFSGASGKGTTGGYACPCYCFGSFTDNDEKCCGEGNSERCRK
jgi:hypothetical protein